MAKRCTLTLGVKIQALDEVEKRVKSKAAIAREYRVPCSTLSTWIKNSASLRLSGGRINPATKRRRNAKHVDVESALVRWYHEARVHGISPCGSIVQAKARDLANDLGIEGFICNGSWLDRFKRRHCISFQTSFNKNKLKRNDKIVNDVKGHNTTITHLVRHGCQVTNVKQEENVSELQHISTTTVIPQTSCIKMEYSSEESDYVKLLPSHLSNNEEEKSAVLPMAEIKDYLPRFPLLNNRETTKDRETTIGKIAYVPNDLSKLDLEEVSQCLVELDLSKHVERFHREKIDGSLLMDLDSDVLQTDLGFSKFEALKLVKFVKGWRPKLNKTADITNM